jgi:hypothetical protein
MGSPTYNGSKIFDSFDASNNNFTEGCLWVQPADPILQPIHFEGEIGSIVLSHGQGDMAWEFNGLISATSSATFFNILSTLQTNLTNTINNPSTYYTLVDSFGNVYDNAQLRHIDPVAPHTQSGGGLVAALRVTGVVQGTVQYGSST